MYNKIGNSTLSHLIFCLPLTLNIHSFVFLLYHIPGLCIFGKKHITFLRSCNRVSKTLHQYIKKKKFTSAWAVCADITPHNQFPTLVNKAGHLNIWPEIYKTPVPESPFRLLCIDYSFWSMSIWSTCETDEWIQSSMVLLIHTLYIALAHWVAPVQPVVPVA